MKRVITLLMAAVMVIGTAGLASAVEFGVSGHMHILMGAQDNGNLTTGEGNFNKDVDEDNFFAAQRFRPKLTVSAEGVTMVFEAQQHQYMWGDNGRNGTSNINADVRVRQAYIDFMLPSTPVSLKLGIQQLNLPSIWGHPVFETRTGAAVATIPFNDQIAVALFYARPEWNNTQISAYNTATQETVYADFERAKNSVDMYGILLPMDFDTVKATPYFVYSHVGKNTLLAGYEATWDQTSQTWNYGDSSDDSATYIVGGVNLELAAADALSVKVDGIITNLSSDDDGLDIGTGWHVAVAVDYEMPFGTPGIFGWYSSGFDDKGEKGFFSPGYTDGFGPTSLGYEGYNTFWNGAYVGTAGMSTWGIGLQVADMSFIDSLKHTLRVTYIKGTSDKGDENDPDKVVNGGWDNWNKDDSFIEINLDSTWSIYENLAAVVELGYIIPDLSEESQVALPNKSGRDDNAWRASVTLRFSF